MSVIGPAPRVYLITDRRALAPRALDEVITEALRAVDGTAIPRSAVAVQLREKDLEAGALLDHARRLRAITAAAGVRLFVNDRVDVALAAGADGVHLSGRSLGADAVHAFAPELQIALSTHRIEEVARAAADGHVSFVVFGPIFDTPSKRGHGQPLGLERLREASALGVPLLAIGGIDIAKIEGCRGAGASGIACIRAVLRNPDPEGAIRAIFERIEST